MFLSIAKIKIAENDIVIPNEGIIWPETTPLPPGYRRGFHSMVNFNDLADLQQRMDSVRKHGLSLEHARGMSYGEPNMIWGTPNWEHAYNKDVPNVEFRISPEKLKRLYTPWYRDVERDPEYYDEWWKGSGHIAIEDSIPPEDIIAIHEPWHRHLEHMLKEDPKNLPEYLEALRSLDPERYADYAGLQDYLRKHGLL